MALAPIDLASQRKLRRMQRNEQRSRALQPLNPRSPFRRIEQYYKRKLWPPDFLGFSFGHHSIPPAIRLAPHGSFYHRSPRSPKPLLVHFHSIAHPQPCPICRPPHVLAPGPSSHALTIYTFPDKYPGLVYLPNYLCAHGQKTLVRDCFENALKSPNATTNLDTHWRLPEQGTCGAGEGVYELYRQWRLGRSQGTDSGGDLAQDGHRYILQPRATTDSKDPAAGAKREEGPEKKATSRRHKIELEPITPQNFRNERNQAPKADPEPSRKVKPIHVRDAWLGGKIRWCTIGYQYHWPSKTYHFDRPPSPISSFIHSLCTSLVNRAIPWDLVSPPLVPSSSQGKQVDPIQESWTHTYKPEAGVINFYQPGDSLTGHIDHSEVSLTSPLVSVSVGLSCVFLVSHSTAAVPCGLPPSKTCEEKHENGDRLPQEEPHPPSLHSAGNLDSSKQESQQPGRMQQGQDRLVSEVHNQSHQLSSDLLTVLNSSQQEPQQQQPPSDSTPPNALDHSFFEQVQRKGQQPHASLEQQQRTEEERDQEQPLHSPPEPLHSPQQHQQQQEEEFPLEFKLDSGDALILSGQSRRLLHGVPRIIENSLPDWITQHPVPPGPGHGGSGGNHEEVSGEEQPVDQEKDDDDDDGVWLDWLKIGGRINLNIRQVF